MADWPLAADGSVVQSAALTGTSVAPRITGSVTAHTKGAYTELISATDYDSSWLTVTVPRVSAIDEYLIDIAIGAAASETVILGNLLVGARGVVPLSNSFGIPLDLPAGSRISARCQSRTGGSDTADVQVVVVGGGFKASSGLARVTSYGPNTATTAGISIDPGGTAHTKGAWVEVTAATTSETRWLLMGIGNQGNSARSISGWLVDIGIGAAAAEQVIVPNLFTSCPNASQHFTPTMFSLPVAVPEGSRLAVRAQCDIIDATDRTFDVALYGVN